MADPNEEPLDADAEFEKIEAL
jgi:hypothetical protein